MVGFGRSSKPVIPYSLGLHASNTRRLLEHLGVQQAAVVGHSFPELARNVAESIPGAELVLFPNVGHNPHLEAPERFHEALIRFLRPEPVEAGPRRGIPEWRSLAR